MSLQFKSEQEKDEAIIALGENPGDDYEEKLSEIEGAEIVVQGENTDGDNTSTDSTKEKSVEKSADETPVANNNVPEEVEDEVYTVKRSELPEGYKSLGHVLKAFSEKDTLIGRQSEKIRELVERPASPQVMKRVETAEANLERSSAESGGQQPSAKISADIAAIKTEISRIGKLQAELEEMANKDEDVAFTAEYRRKERELQALQTKNIIALTDVYEKAQSDIIEARSVQQKYIDAKDAEERSARVASSRESTYREVDNIKDPEYKMSKPVKVVEEEYLDWRRKLATAYYNRPPKSEDEIFFALKQAELKNPQLAVSCQTMGIGITPSSDVKRYLDVCDILSYKNGKRINAATGEEYTVTRYNSQTGEHEPCVIGSLDEAVEKYRGETGYYKQEAENRYQKGAEAAAKARMRRDSGAVELGADDNQGGNTITKDDAWANKVLKSTDYDTAVRKAQRGDMQAFNDYNEALKISGVEPIDLPPS